MQTVEEYVPVIGVNHFWAITALLEKLVSLPRPGANEVQASPVENGYSVGAITIALFVVESAIRRAQYIRRISARERPLDYVWKHHSRRQAAHDLEELFVVRDAIVHNHIWEARISYDQTGEMRLVSAKLREDCGDDKFRRVVDQTTRMTRRLGLNAFPTRICFDDVVVVLNKAVDFLLELEAEDKRIFCFSRQPIQFKGKVLPFIDLVRSLGGTGATEGKAGN